MNASPPADASYFDPLELIEATPGMTAYFDAPERRCRYATRSASGWLGHPPESLVGRTVKELLGAAYEEVAPHLERALRGESVTFERFVEGPVGSLPRWGETTYVPHIVDGLVRGVFVFVSDSSTRKQAERTTAENTRLLECMCENIPVMVFMKEAKHLRTVRMNAEAESFLGITRSDILGTRAPPSLTREQLEISERSDREALAGGRVVDLPNQVMQTPRGERILHTRKVPILDETGAPEYLLGISLDVTEARRAAAALEQAKTAAEQAEAAVRVYQQRLQSLLVLVAETEERERRRLAMLLHDGVGQALALARIRLEALKANPDGISCAGLQEVLALIERSIAGTRALTFDLSPPVLYDLGLAAAISWLIDKLAADEGMVVRLRHDAAYDRLGDATAFIVFRAVRELLLNVRKHANTLAATVSLATVGAQLEVVVEDRGVGVAPQAATRGFGLMSVSEQVRSVGGVFELSSRAGGGTTARLLVSASAAGSTTSAEPL